MSRQITKTDDIHREHYFTKMIENAENALRVCRNAENRPFTLPSICSVGAILWNDEKCVFPAEKKGGIDAVTKQKTTCMIRAPTKIPIAHTDNGIPPRGRTSAARGLMTAAV